jgi:hypothetical protein
LVIGLGQGTFDHGQFNVAPQKGRRRIRQTPDRGHAEIIHLFQAPTKSPNTSRPLSVSDVVREGCDPPNESCHIGRR